MSTKSTLTHGDGFHFYTELFDDGFVHLQLEGIAFEAYPNAVTIRIPNAIWEAIRDYPTRDSETK